MKIIKFTKQKLGQYKLTLDDNSKLLLHEDLILKNNLLVTKEIDDIDSLIKENNNFLAYNYAIKYISIKMRSIYEMKDYLLKKEIDDQIIEMVIDKLINQGYLNDELYTKAFINDKITLTDYGPKKIYNLLKNMFINEEIINKYIYIFNDEIQIEKINKVINKMIKLNHNKGLFLLKQKILNHLIDLGYDRELINQELLNINIDEKEMFQKEYKKLYDKLSKKYSDKELEYKIKEKLYQKGFSIH